jgi:hypothetical protein
MRVTPTASGSENRGGVILDRFFSKLSPPATTPKVAIRRTQCIQNVAGNRRGYVFVLKKTDFFPLFDFLRPGSAHDQHKF